MRVRPSVKHVSSTRENEQNTAVSSRISALFRDHRGAAMKFPGERVCEEIAVFELEFAFDDGVARLFFLFRFFVFVDSEVYEWSSLV